MNYDMKTDTSRRIIDYIKENKQVAPHALIDYLNISDRAVFKQLHALYSKGIIDKIGKPPSVYYFIKDKEITTVQKTIFTKANITTSIIEKNYLIITPAGERLEGIKGFSYWCVKNKLPIDKTAKEYEVTFRKYAKYKKGNLIDGTGKLKQTFKEIFVEKLYYMDFYSIERFGKTKLGWLLLYAKQSQNKTLIKEICQTIKERVLKVIEKYKIQAVGFIPPTVKRDVQLMAEVEKYLGLSLPRIQLRKIRTPLIVPQKTLSKLADRIENARLSIFVGEQKVYTNILLFDDAVGSGSTINETARKIREKGEVKGKIYGLAITGSFKGFEVISEV